MPSLLGTEPEMLSNALQKFIENKIHEKQLNQSVKHKYERNLK